MAAPQRASLPSRQSVHRSQSKGPSAGQHDFPAAFTIDGSNRHEFIMVNPGHDLDDLKNMMAVNLESSPNCAEFMHKYRSKESREMIGDVRVRWSVEGRDSKIFPRETKVTEENCEAVLRMMAVGVGKDVFDIRVEAKKVEEKKAEKAPGGKK